MNRIVDLLKIVDKMTLHEALVDPDPTITATNLVGRWCSGGRPGHECTYDVLCSHRVRGRKMLPIAMALERDRSGPRQEGEQEQAGLVPFSSSSSWLELSPIPAYLCSSPSFSSSSMCLSSAYPPSTSYRTDLYGDHAGVTVNLGDDDSGQSKVSLISHLRMYIRM